MVVPGVWSALFYAIHKPQSFSTLQLQTSFSSIRRTGDREGHTRCLKVLAQKWYLTSTQATLMINSHT